MKHPSGTPIPSGSQVTVEVHVFADKPIAYQWRADEGKGEIIQGETSSAAVWQAPEKPGTYLVYVDVAIGDTLQEKSVAIEVVLPPAPTFTPTLTPLPTLTPSPTTTPTLTPTLTPTATATPTPTSTHAATPTPPPCPFLSARVRLTNPPVDIVVEFTDPRNCTADLPTFLPIGGTYTGNLQGWEVWILVVPTNSQYYVQGLNDCERGIITPSDILGDATGGRWSTQVNFGGDLQQYDLVAVLAEVDSPASQSFRERLTEFCTITHVRSYFRDELLALDGLVEVAAITVCTKQSC